MSDFPELRQRLANAGQNKYRYFPVEDVRLVLDAYDVLRFEVQSAIKDRDEAQMEFADSWHNADELRAVLSELLTHHRSAWNHYGRAARDVAGCEAIDRKALPLLSRKEDGSTPEHPRPDGSYGWPEATPTRRAAQ